MIRRRDARPRALLGAVCLAVMLAGCTPSSPQAASSATTNPPEKTSPSPTATVSVEPVIVVAAVDVDGKHVTASGYVPGVIEDGGTCTFAFTKEGAPTVTVERSGVADRSSTACGAAQPEIAQFVRGTWAVTLKYSSDSGEFESEPQRVEVP